MSVTRTTARALAASALLLPGILALPALSPPALAAPAPVVADAPDAAVAPALAWMAGELADSGHVLGQTLDFGDGPTFFPDYGLTADTVMAMALAGEQPTEAALARQAIADHLGDYVTSGTFGPDDRYAGALAKTLLLTEVTHQDRHDFGGFDVEAELRARLRTTGDQAGRFSDLTPFGDFSNGFAQPLAILALSRTPGRVPAAAVAFLLDQQCPGGGFRLAYTDPGGSPTGCVADADAQADATAFAVDALRTVPRTPAVTAALDAAVQYLLGAQTEAGGFPGSDGAADTNTAGLAGQALRSAGEAEAADLAAAYIRSAQVTAEQAGDGPAADEVGAIALAPELKDAAIEHGIADAKRDQWHRATAQAVLGLGLAPYATTPPARTADLDGSGTTDLAVFRPSTGRWYVKGQGPSVSWGTNGDVPVPGDYDGDGTTDLAVFRPSTGRWYVKGAPTVAFGTAGDVPVPGDYDGNGTTDLAVFRPSNGRWYVLGRATTAWGTAGDVPVPGDYDGDGTTDLAVFRPSNGRWYVLGRASIGFGAAGDVPVPGDYDGDGTTDLATFRAATGEWSVRGGATVVAGAAGDRPVPGDYDGDGTTDVATFRPTGGTWTVAGGAPVQWGTGGDLPASLPVGHA